MGLRWRHGATSRKQRWLRHRYQVDSSTCYTYDGDGDLVARTNCNVSGVGYGTITGVLAEFLYDTGHRLLAEVNAGSQADGEW